MTLIFSIQSYASADFLTGSHNDDFLPCIRKMTFQRGFYGYWITGGPFERNIGSYGVTHRFSKPTPVWTPVRLLPRWRFPANTLSSPCQFHSGSAYSKNQRVVVHTMMMPVEFQRLLPKDENQNRLGQLATSHIADGAQHVRDQHFTMGPFVTKSRFVFFSSHSYHSQRTAFSLDRSPAVRATVLREA